MPPGSTGFIDLSACSLEEASDVLVEDLGWGAFNINSFFQEGAGLVVSSGGALPTLAGPISTQMQAGGIIVFDMLLEEGSILGLDFHDVGFNIEYGGSVGYTAFPSNPRDTQAWVQDFGMVDKAETGMNSLVGFNRAAFKMIDGSLVVSNLGSAVATLTGRTAWTPNPPTQFGLSVTSMTLLKITAYPATANLQVLSAI